MSYKIRSRIWIESNNKIFLGEGRVMLLKSLNETQSLSKSAKKLGISYKKAWNLIDSVNNNSVKPLVQKNTGGSGGGGTFLTPYGIKMIANFESINKKCWEFLDGQLSEIKDFI